MAGTVTGGGGGATPDKKTIFKDADENFQARYIAARVIGDFESGLGDWSANDVDGGTNSHGTSTAQSYFGTQSYSIDVGDNNWDPTVYLQRTVDLTDENTLIFWIYPERQDSGGNVIIKVGGTVEYSDTGNLTEDAWMKVEIDVSGYSGDQTVRIEASDTDGNNTQNCHIYVDNVQLIGGTHAVPEGGAG